MLVKRGGELMENFFIVTCLVVFAYLIFCSANKKRHRLQKKSFVFFAMAMTVLLFGACSAKIGRAHV